MLANIVATVGALLGLIGVVVLVSPRSVRHLVPTVWSPRLIYGAVTSRILVGALFIVASDACSRPMAIGTLGVFALAAGLSGLFIGTRRIEALIAWFLKFSDTVFRAWGLSSALIGAFIIYAAVL